jgi:glycosyltransferase involved in cell wall biosynthesis
VLPDPRLMHIFMLVQRPGVRSPVPKHTAHLVAALGSLGCTVVTHPWGRAKESEALTAKLTQRLRDVLSVRRALQGEEFDVAVVKTAHDWRTVLRDIAAVLVIRRRCRPVILQLHGSRPSSLIEAGHRVFKLATAVLLALVDGVMVLSTEEQRQWHAFRRRPPVFTVKNPYVRLSSSPRRSTSTSTPRARALFVGRLMSEKGVFDIVEALPEVLEQTECDLVIVGEGNQEQELRDRIRRLGLRDHVTMTGYLAGSELTDIYREASIFVLPTSWFEGFPTVLAEAMDAGLPIVTTPIRGAADYLVAGEHALFVERGDVKGLASAMITLLHDQELRARMASANRERIQIFEPGVVAAEYLQILQTLVRERPGDRAAAQAE